MPRPRTGLSPADWAIAAIAVLALVAGCTSTEASRDAPGPGAEPATSGASDEPVRIKGLAPHLSVHRQGADGVEQLRDGSAAREGDLVQLSYVAAGNRYGVVLSLDGGGVVTLHHPERVQAPATLVSHGEHALDHAYQLDDAQTFERFVFVTSGDEPLDPGVVIAAARDLAQRGEAARHSALPLPGRWQQSSVTLHKRP